MPEPPFLPPSQWMPKADRDCFTNALIEGHRDPVVPVLPQIFTAMTGWQAEDWFVEARISGFLSHHEAELFANAMGNRLVLDLAARSLCLVDAKGQAHPLADDNVKVFRQKPEAKGKVTTTMDDYEEVQVRIADFVNHPDLCRGFGSSYYAVE